MKPQAKLLRVFLTISLISIVQITHALPTETEYLGNIAAAGYYDDEAWGAFPIGFSFDFFGNTYNDFYVTSNGLVMFGSSSRQFRNRSIPDTRAPNNYIAPFWDDIVIHETGDIMYQTIGTAPNRKLMIQFTNMSFWDSPILLGTFQVILYEGSNNIQTQYRSIVDLTSDRASGNSATIGLENSSGTAGVQASFRVADYIQSEKAILYTPGGGTYTFDDNAIYEGILLQDVISRASTPNLVSPANNSTVGDTVTFTWEAAANASSYFVVISQNSDLGSPIHTSADLTDLSYEYILSNNQTYYWSAYSKNSVGTVSWSEIWSFQTSPVPPLHAVPQTIYMEQGQQRTATLVFTGGDAGSKVATVTTLPAEGSLYQYNGGVPGAEILSVPTDVSDPSFKLIYSASGNSGNGVGDFDFHFTDATWTSGDETFTINVSPPGIPNFVHASKEIDRVEITFDRNMSDPTGKHLEFSVQDNGIDVTSNSCSLKPGDPTTIIVYVTPNLNTNNSIGVAYTKGTVTAESGGILESFDFQIAGKLAQVINFSSLSDKTFGDADYTLSATASSNLPITFSSSNITVVSVSGTTASVNIAGEALIVAYQAGDATYAPISFEQHQLVNKATAAVTIGNLVQEYTSSGIAVTVTTVPVNLNVKVDYDGSTTLPVDLGSYAVTADVEEANYSGSASEILIINDITAPVPDLPTLPNLTRECAATPNAPTATDFYSGAITGTTLTTFPITAQGTTVVTWNYDDGNGNVSNQPQNVIINDVTDPDTPTLDDVTGECTATAVAPTTTDACAGTLTGTTTDPVTYSTQGSHLITWTFDDGNGNSIAVDQNVIVADVTDPDTPTLDDVTGECTATADAPTTTDACAGTLTGTTTDPVTYSTQGTHVITWTFDDGNGNAITVDQNVIIDDITDPDMPTLADVTEQCSATVEAPTTTDNCAGTITGTTTDPITYSSQDNYVITWTFDDGNGNSITADQNIIISDITDPDIPILGDVTGECSATATLAPTTTDNCAGTITGTTTDPLSYTSQGTHMITWTFDDGNGNVITASQNVIVDDVTDPDMPTLADITDECSANVEAPTTTDNCAGTITGTTTDPLSYTSQGTYAITWTFDDGNGNVITANQNVFVDDVTDPDMPTLADITDECSATALAPATTDNCAGTITGTTSDPLTYTTQGSYVIMWTFDDGNGNVITANQNVLIEDVTDPNMPTLADVTEQCSAIVETPTTTDNCAGTITGTTTDPVTYTTQGSYVIMWTFDDGNGNVITANQNVVIADITAPSATCPGDETTCDGLVSSIGLTDVIDNCSSTITVSYILSGSTSGSGTGDASMELFNPGVTTITYTLDDGNGNTSMCSFSVSNEKIEEIVVSFVDNQLTVENEGSYQWINCLDNSIISGETESTFAPAENGEYAVIVTRGACSDTSTCQSITLSGIGRNGMVREFEVYPVPAEEFVTIDIGHEHTNATIKVVNVMGQTVLVRTMDKVIKTNLDVSGFDAGLYLILFESDQMNGISRIVKE